MARRLPSNVCLGCEKFKREEWRKNNPERTREFCALDRKKNSKRRAQNSKEWRKKNPGKAKENKKLWHEKNKRYVLEYNKKYRERNPHYASACVAVRRARKAKSIGAYTNKQIENLLKKQHGKCVNCGDKSKLQVDHIVPLKLGGANDIKNIQLLCRQCNCRKSAKDPIKWAQENGRLL